MPRFQLSSFVEHNLNALTHFVLLFGSMCLASVPATVAFYREIGIIPASTLTTLSLVILLCHPTRIGIALKAAAYRFDRMYILQKLLTRTYTITQPVQFRTGQLEYHGPAYEYSWLLLSCVYSSHPMRHEFKYIFRSDSYGRVFYTFCEQRILLDPCDFPMNSIIVSPGKIFPWKYRIINNTTVRIFSLSMSGYQYRGFCEYYRIQRALRRSGELPWRSHRRVIYARRYTVQLG